MLDVSSILRHTQIMPQSAAPHAFDLPARLAKHNIQWPASQSTSASWASGAPLGNGDFGAMVYGLPDNLSFLLGKNDLWLRRSDPSRFPGKSYADVIDMYRRRDREAFERLLPSDKFWMDNFMPSSLIQAGMFRVHLGDAGNVGACSCELSLYDATWRMKFDMHGLDNMWMQSPDFEVTAFASAKYEVLGIRITRARLPLRSFTWRLGRESHRLLAPAKLGAASGAGAGRDGQAWFEQALPRDDRYALALLQQGEGVQITCAKRSILGECEGEHIEPGAGGGVTIWIAGATQRDVESGGDVLGLARERVRAAAAAGWDVVHAQHREEWASFWSRSWIDTPDVALEKPWYLSQYYTGSILRPGKTSPGLQGMWCKENQPPWNADFHGNVNIQAVYHGTAASNHAELFEPYATLYHGMLPLCEADTLRYFGIEGARFPHAGGIDGHEQTEDAWGPLAVSIYPTAWLARMFWWQYQYTLDREFLEHVAYPIIKKAAQFLAGMLKLSGHGPDGKYLVEPSIWGEHACTSFDAFGTDSGYDIGTHLCGLSQAVAAAEALGVDGALVQQWRRDLAELPAMPVDQDDRWIFWRSHPKFPAIHVEAGSFFAPVYPQELVSIFHGTPENRRAALASWKAASAKICNSWCGGAPVAGAARMGDADWCYRAASAAPRYVVGVGGTEPQCLQVDHAPGLSLALCSMLVLGVDGLLVPFPALPAHVDIAFHSLRAPGAVLVSGEQKGGRIVHLAIQTLVDGPLRVLSPFRGSAEEDAVVVCVRNLVDGSEVLRQKVSHRGELRWNGKANSVYRMLLVEEG